MTVLLRLILLLTGAGLLGYAAYDVAMFVQKGDPTDLATAVFCGVIGAWVFFANTR